MRRRLQRIKKSLLFFIYCSLYIAIRMRMHSARREMCSLTYCSFSINAERANTSPPSVGEAEPLLVTKKEIPSKSLIFAFYMYNHARRVLNRIYERVFKNIVLKAVSEHAMNFEPFSRIPIQGEKQRLSEAPFRTISDQRDYFLIKLFDFPKKIVYIAIFGGNSFGVNESLGDKPNDQFISLLYIFVNVLLDTFTLRL